jgi:hypothetical protein
MLGILSFATVPGAFALAYLGVNFAQSLLVVFFAAGILLGLLAVVTGRRANASIRQSQERIIGEERATAGTVWGYLGLGIWSLPVILYIITLALPHRFLGDVSPGVGALRIIHEAAAAYSCSYGHGFPPTLAAMGPPKTRWFHATPAPNEEAAGFST